MNKLLMSMMAVVLMLAACSKNNGADVSELLKTIPADASLVMVMDLEGILKDADCSVDNGQIRPGKKFAEALKQANDPELRSKLETLNDSGIEWSSAAIFVEGYNTYLTGFLSDSGKFRQVVEERFGEKFESGEVNTCGNVAVDGERFWVCLNSHNTIVANDIRHFKSLSEKQSILSNENVAKLSTITTDIAGWGDIKGTLNLAGLNFATRAAVTMGLETVFVDAVEVEWTASFDKDEMVAEIAVLNTKGGIAKFNFPVETIDENVVKNLNMEAEGFGALAISEKMIETVREQTSQEGFSLLGALVNMMGSVQGTTAMAFDDDNTAGVISTTGHGTADLSDALSQWGFAVSKEGKDLKFSRGAVSGAMTSAEAAEMLKGAVCGVAVSPLEETDNKCRALSFCLKPEKGGLKGELRLKGADAKKPFLLGLISK